MLVVVDSYNESNRSGGNLYDGNSGNSNKVSQSFTGNGMTLDSAVVALRRSNTPGGICRAYIYAHSGSFGTSSIPSGLPLATSNDLNVSELSTTYELKTFTFSGGNRITLSDGTKYCLVIEFSLTGSSPNMVGIGTDETSSTHPGNYAAYLSGTWYPASPDLIFYIYGEEEEEDPPDPVIVDPPEDPVVSSKRIAIAKKGKSALSTNPNDFIFHSDYNTFKIIKSILHNITLASNTTNQSFTVAHGLPFIPLVRGFAKESGYDRVFMPNSENISGWSSVVQVAFGTGVKFNYIASDDTNIIVNFDNTNSSTRDVSVRLFCLEGIVEGVIPPNNGTPTGNRVGVAKPGYNAQTETDPRNLKFSSEYGTLKYLFKGHQTVILDAYNAPFQQAYAELTHNFGYYMYAEPYVRVSSEDFEPAPFDGSGATVLYGARVFITPNKIELLAYFNGVSFDISQYEFIIFLYRNNLNL